MKTIPEDAWIDAYKPLPSPVPGNGFDYGEGCTLIAGNSPDETKALADADPACVWTVLDGETYPVIVSGCHLVNRLGHIITAVPRGDDEDVRVEMDD